MRGRERAEGRLPGADKTRAREAVLTGAGHHRNVAQEGQDLWAEEGAVPDVEELVEEGFHAGEPLLQE